MDQKYGTEVWNRGMEQRYGTDPSRRYGTGVWNGGMERVWSRSLFRTSYFDLPPYIYILYMKKIYIYIYTYPGLNFTYGSRPSFCTKVSKFIKFLTSAIIKWWFSTSRGLRKMTTWYCYKMKICFYMFLSSGYLKGTLPKGSFPCYKMRLGFYMLSSDGQILLLQNDFRCLKVFQLRKRWKRIKCNSQAVGTKCLAHPHFFILT